MFNHKVTIMKNSTKLSAYEVENDFFSNLDEDLELEFGSDLMGQLDAEALDASDLDDWDDEDDDDFGGVF
jgi:hypothetical protein